MARLRAIVVVGLYPYQSFHTSSFTALHPIAYSLLHRLGLTLSTIIEHLTIRTKEQKKGEKKFQLNFLLSFFCDVLSAFLSARSLASTEHRQCANLKVFIHF